MVADWKYIDNNDTWQLAHGPFFAIITKDVSAQRWYITIARATSTSDVVDQQRYDTVKQYAEKIIEEYVEERFMKW